MIQAAKADVCSLVHNASGPGLVPWSKRKCRNKDFRLKGPHLAPSQLLTGGRNNGEQQGYPLPARTKWGGVLSSFFKLLKILLGSSWSHSVKSLIRRESTICNQRVGGSNPSANYILTRNISCPKAAGETFSFRAVSQRDPGRKRDR
jgi:hypothetical protein